MKTFMLGTDQREFADAIGSVMNRHGAAGNEDADSGLWNDLAELGLFGLRTPAVGGTPLDLVVGFEALGAHLCPGPVVATAAAAELLHGDQLDAMAAGKLRVTLTDGRYVPWANTAELLIKVDHSAGASLCTAVGQLVDEPVMSGERWGVGLCKSAVPLGEASGALVMFDLALSSYLLGAARRLIAQGCRHASTRMQFGRPIGSFQAVAHPLAASSAEVGASWALAQFVATEAAAGSAPPARTWQLRRAAVRASLNAAAVVHQVMGAMGFATETGVASVSTRIRQWSLLPPCPPAPGSGGSS